MQQLVHSHILIFKVQSISKIMSDGTPFCACSCQRTLPFALSMLIVLLFICLGGSVVCYASENSYERLSKGVPFDEPPCFILASDVMLSRLNAKQGFHRSVLTNVSVGIESSCDRCRFMILEHLPEGMYVDSYQLKTLEEFGAPAVLTLDEIDVEKPEHLSTNHTIAIYTSHIKPSTSDHMTGHPTASIDLPVHLRYHAPSYDLDVNHAEVYLPLPELFIHCTECPSDACSNDTGLIQAPCTASNHTICAWTPLDYTMESYEELVFSVPVGQAWQSIAVAVVTLIAITVGMVALLVAMTMKKDKKGIKQR